MRIGREVNEAAAIRTSASHRAATWMADVAPELVATWSDNDPTNIGTAVAVGARSGYQLTWVAVLVAPLLAIVVRIAAAVTQVTGLDLQTLAIRRYGRPLASALLMSIVVANVITIAADLGAAASAISAWVGVTARAFVVPCAIFVLVALAAGRYRFALIALRFLVLGLLVFLASAVVAHPDWASALRGTLVPRLSLSGTTMNGVLALLGTTLGSYVFVWETVARSDADRRSRGGRGPRSARLTGGIWTGAVLTALLLWSMIVTSAATLGRHHIAFSSIRSAGLALSPIAGSAAPGLFAAGLLVTAAVALPVLLDTTAQVLFRHAPIHLGRRCAEGGTSRSGLDSTPGDGYRLYLVASGAVACVIALAGPPVPDMLVFASVAAGVAAPVTLGFLLILARSLSVMGEQRIGGGWTVAGWGVTAGMALLGVVVIARAAGA